MLDLSLPNLYSRINKIEQRLATAEIWRGPYVAGKVYVPNDVVMYNGDVYIALAQNFNTLPTDTTKWTLLSHVDRQVNYAFNGGFDMSSQTSVFTSTTGFTQCVAGWGHSKDGAGDACTVSFTDPAGDDIPGGTLMAAFLSRTSGTSPLRFYQEPVPRIAYALRNKVFTISARVWCTNLGTTSIIYYNGAAWVTGVANAVAAEWTTISMTLPITHAFVSSHAWGVVLAGGITTNAYVNNFQVTEGPEIPTHVPDRAPTNAGNITGGAYRSRAPVCYIDLGTNNYWNPTVGIYNLAPLIAVDMDTDNMSATASRITVRTPGRYAVWAAAACYGGTVNTSWILQPWLNGTLSLPRNTTSGWAFPQGMSQYIAGGGNMTYQSKELLFIEDFVEGEYMTLNLYPYAGVTSFLFNGTGLGMIWLGD